MPRQFGFVTLDVGDKAIVYDREGQARIEEGPQRIFLWQEKFVRLSKHTANQNQYLQIRFRDGPLEHVSGPCAMHKVPTQHDSVMVKDAISLDANEILVVYKRNTENDVVTRYLRHGPTMFVPKANEWLHQFVWHGTDKENKTRKIPGGLRFEKLRVIPDQFYYNVNTRSKDDTIMRVKLMIFYELENIENMLAGTDDPIADFINCLGADVMGFTSKYTYLEFMEKSNELNDLTNYPQLCTRCKKIGFLITKVVFRGYYATDQLQRMHEQAIEKRTKLKIAFESEEQNQVLIDMKLRSETERTAMEQSMELEHLKHSQEMAKSQLDHKLLMARKTAEEKVKEMKKDFDDGINAKRAESKEKVIHYQKLADMNVSLTEYLVAGQARPDKVIQIVSSANTPANIHLHQN